MDRKRAWYLANKEKCHKAQKKYRTSNPEKIKISARRRKYGPEANTHFLTQLSLQGSLCAICEKKLVSGRSTQLDHDHRTKQLRGILCLICNARLGTIESVWVQKAVAYLEKWEQIRLQNLNYPRVPSFQC